MGLSMNSIMSWESSKGNFPIANAWSSGNWSIKLIERCGNSTKNQHKAIFWRIKFYPKSHTQLTAQSHLSTFTTNTHKQFITSSKFHNNFRLEVLVLIIKKNLHHKDWEMIFKKRLLTSIQQVKTLVIKYKYLSL